jgi:hypothetical protein
MEPAMLGRAVEDIAGHHALAPREVHAALRATHHVFGTGGGAGPRPGPCAELSLVRLEKPVHTEDDEDEDEIFQRRSSGLRIRHRGVRYLRAASLPQPFGTVERYRPHRTSVRKGKKIGRGERIRTSDSCVPNAVLYQAELHPDVGEKRGGDAHEARGALDG